MKAPTKRETRCLAASLAIVTALATSGAWARNQYWSDGSGDHKWSTASNWSGSKSDNAEFRGSKFNPEATSYVININGNQTATWKLYVCGVGSENTPLVFRNTDKDKTLTIGSDGYGTYDTGYYIAYNEGDAWLQLECGKYTTYNHSNARWYIGSDNYKGYVIVDEDATLVSIGKMFLNQGTVYVKSGGKMTFNTWCSVGALANKTGKVEIDGGEVQSTADRMTIGDVDNSTGIVVIKNGGKYSNTGSSGAGITVGQVKSGTLEVDNGEVDLCANTFNVCDSGSSTASVTIKNGGIVKTKGIVYGSGTGGATISIDGGILKATADNTLIPANNKLTVTVDVGGGTIDTNGKNVTIAKSITGTGGMTFKGHGTIVLSGVPSYTGGTTVEAGTVVVVPDVATRTALGVITVSGLANSVCEVVRLSGAETFSADNLPADTEDTTFRVSPDGKSILAVNGMEGSFWIGGSGDLGTASNWSDGEVPEGNLATISWSSPITLTKSGSAFAPSSITFLEGSAAVTIDGDDFNNIVAVTNLSSASHTINAKVYFTSGINVKQNASSFNYISQSHVTFAGGAYAANGKTVDSGYSVAMFGKYYFANTSDWTATEDGDSRKALADNSELYVPKAGNTINLYIGNGSKVNVAKTSLSTGRLSYKNYGEMVVTNLTLGYFSSDLFLTWNQGVSNPSVFRFNSVTNTSSSGKFLFFADGNVATKTTLYFGAGGVGFSGSGLTSGSLFAFGKDVTNNETTIRPWDSDFTIGGKSNTGAGIRFGKRVIFNTDDDSGVGHTITLAANYYGGTGASVDIGGSGKLLVTGTTGSGAYPMTVTDTATLAVGASGSLGTGAITLGAGTTLALTANSSTFAALTNTLNLPTTGTATIRIDGTRLSPGVDHEIATVGTGSTENVVLDPASTALGNRKAELRVEGGRLLLSIKSAGTIFIVR